MFLSSAYLSCMFRYSPLRKSSSNRVNFLLLEGIKYNIQKGFCCSWLIVIANSALQPWKLSRGFRNAGQYTGVTISASHRPVQSAASERSKINFSSCFSLIRLSDILQWLSATIQVPVISLSSINCIYRWFWIDIPQKEMEFGYGRHGRPQVDHRWPSLPINDRPTRVQPPTYPPNRKPTTLSLEYPIIHAEYT